MDLLYEIADNSSNWKLGTQPLRDLSLSKELEDRPREEKVGAETINQIVFLGVQGSDGLGRVRLPHTGQEAAAWEIIHHVLYIAQGMELLLLGNVQ